MQRASNKISVKIDLVLRRDFYRIVRKINLVYRIKLTARSYTDLVHIGGFVTIKNEYLSDGIRRVKLFISDLLLGILIHY